MSTEGTLSSEELVLDPAAAAAAPKDFILYSYNALDHQVARAPDKFMHYLRNHLASPVPDSEIITQTVAQHFASRYHEDKSAQETFSKIALSVGIEGKYGFFSGSIQATYDKEETQKSTSFNSNLTATISCGSVYYKDMADMRAIRTHLDPVMISKLDAIATLKDAHDFTERYGTHLILGLNIGGVLTIRAQAATSEYSKMEEVSVKVKAAYDTGINSISAAASAAQKLSANLSSSSFTQVIIAAGGNSTLAAAINPEKPETFETWARSCTADTTYGISNSLEIWKLATGNAHELLQRYCNLRVLCQSLNRPTIFSAYQPLKAYITNSITAVPAEDYKVISGGASVTRAKTSFLESSCPSFDTRKTKIVGWTASSHDILEKVEDGQHITAYAIGVYDPGNLLETTVVSVENPQRDSRDSKATATINSSYILTGGGCQTDVFGHSHRKLMIACYPSAEHEWTARIHDWESAAHDVLLTAHAIGVKCQWLRIESTVVKSPGSSIDQHGLRHASVPHGMAIAGGGVEVKPSRAQLELIGRPDGFGNLVQQTYPSASGTWTEFNKDHGGSKDPVESHAYAIGLTAKLNF